MKVGYARAATDDQDLSLQLGALQLAGCGKLFQDKESGVKAQRPGLHNAQEYLREGDTLVVWRLDRLSRSLNELIETVQLLEERGIGLQSLQEAIDTTTNGGKLVFHIFRALAEFERNLIHEPTCADLQVARTRTRRGGRQKALDKKKQALLYQLYDEQQYTVKQVCEMLGISKTTLYAYLSLRVK